MNDKKPQTVGCQLHIKASGSLKEEVEKELAAEDEPLEELLDEPQD
jgi:hypothetical protein